MSDAHTNSPPEKDPQATHFPVVGVVASAGGLEAFIRLLSKVPAECGLSFVLIPHLDPKQPSLMAELLEAKIDLPVKEAREGEKIRANRVYVIPPDRYMAVEEGSLKLRPAPPSPSRHTAIDPFLRSLAKDLGERAVGIVLSGTGAHGASGIKEIKLQGGLVLAQQPESADFAQMPRNATATGVVDFTGPPEQMAEELLRLARHRARLAEAAQAELEEQTQGQLQLILELLRNHYKLDFRLYRRTMLLRRINRRMILAGTPTLEAYTERLRQQPGELEALHGDLLINVSAFFREPEAFEILARKVIPELVQQCGPEHPVRVWVPACATGEEAWTLAMLFSEAFSAQSRPPALQIFASDVDSQALQVARRGVYPPSIRAEITAERLARFFNRQSDGSYQVVQALREHVLFASQDLVGDAPFSQLHLISCRNLLIYLEPAVQQKVISVFHFALKPEGHLLLGPSETIRGSEELFAPLSRKHRLFQKQGSGRRPKLELPLLQGQLPRPPRSHPTHSPTSGRSMSHLMQQLLLDQLTPASVLINRHGEVLCFHGAVGDYLEIPAGAPTQDLIAMAR